MAGRAQVIQPPSDDGCDAVPPRLLGLFSADADGSEGRRSKGDVQGSSARDNTALTAGVNNFVAAAGRTCQINPKGE